MTTIVFQGDTLWSDSRITCGNVLVSDNFTKLLKVKDLLVAGFCGDVCEMKEFFTSIKDDENTKLENGSAIVLFKGHKPRVYEDGKHWELDETSFSIGSGSFFAVSALALNLSPKDAILHAMKFDLATGGKVKHVRL